MYQPRGTASLGAYAARRTSALLAGAAVALAAAAPAQADNLWTQQGAPGGHSHAFDYEPPGDVWDTEVADDFRVPAGKRWSVDTLVVSGGLGYPAVKPGVPVISWFPRTFDVTVYTATAGNAPAASAPAARTTLADTVGWPTAQTGPTNGTPHPIGGYRTTMIRLRSPLVLESGTWWLSVRANEEPVGAVGYPTARWFWGNICGAQCGIASSGAAHYRNPGNAWGTGCTTWTVRSRCVSHANAATYENQAFGIIGTETTAR